MNQFIFQLLKLIFVLLISMKKLRLVLFPFALLYGIITSIRNWLYDVGFFSSFSAPIPTIVVGNLSTGGTGKTPHVAHIAQLLQANHNVAILSRGYGRKTTGYILLNDSHSANEVGDEPLLYRKKFDKNVQVAVCEKRVLGITNLLSKFPDLDVIILDDAFQHRAVRGGLNILLSDFHRPFFKDFVLPAGNLREFRSGKKRADICIYTKCPESLTNNEKERYRSAFNQNKSVHFSRIGYHDFIKLTNTAFSSEITHIILVTGIANPQPILTYLSNDFEVHSVPFADHHDFSRTEITKIHEIFGNFTDGKTAIVTTEKDAMRLRRSELKELICHFPWFYLPISVEIEDSVKFNNEIIDYVNSNKRSN